MSLPPEVCSQAVHALLRAGLAGDTSLCRQEALRLVEFLQEVGEAQSAQNLLQIIESVPPKKEYPRPALTVDIVIISWRDGFPHVLLGRRDDESKAFPAFWTLPGGFVNSDEKVEVAARRELREETGLEVEVPLLSLGLFDTPGRDPRGWVVSMAYMADLGTRQLQAKAGDDLKKVAWFRLDQLPTSLAFDHDDILAIASQSLGLLLLRASRS